MAEMAAARYRKSNYSKKSSSSIRSSASARQTPPASPSASPRKGRPHPRDISSVAKSPSKSPGKSGSAAVIPNDHVKVAAASRRSDSPDSTRGAKLSCLAECLPVHVPERDSAGRSLALPGEEEEAAEAGEGHGAGMAKVMSFLVKLKKLPMEHLTQYMSDKQNRNKIWRTIESSRNQKKVARKGIAMGIGVGVEYDRILELHGKGITYTHEDGTLPKTISFHDVRYVGAVGGGRSSRWKIVMKDEKQPCYEFAADTVKARDAWVWCVRNNLHTFTRKNNLDDVLASPNAKTLHNAFSVSNAAVAHDIRPMETMGKLTEENEGTSSFSKPQARHWTA